MAKLSQKMKLRKGRKTGKKPKKKVSKGKKKKKSKKKSKKPRKGKQLKNSKGKKKNRRGGGKAKNQKGKKRRKSQTKKGPTKKGWYDFIRPQKPTLKNSKQNSMNQKQPNLYIFIAFTCSVFILQHLCHIRNSMSTFLSVFCVFHHIHIVCLFLAWCPENKDFSTNCSNSDQSKTLFCCCKEQQLRVTAMVELPYCPAPLPGCYVSAKKEEQGSRAIKIWH